MSGIEVLSVVLSAGTLAGMIVWGAFTIDRRRQDTLNELFPRVKPPRTDKEGR
jgi:hypothetical protein